MKILSVKLTLCDLQEALAMYCDSKGITKPEVVIIESHTKLITVELQEKGLVTSDEFNHRAMP